MGRVVSTGANDVVPATVPSLRQNCTVLVGEDLAVKIATLWKSPSHVVPVLVPLATSMSALVPASVPSVTHGANPCVASVPVKKASAPFSLAAPDSTTLGVVIFVNAVAFAASDQC